MSRSTIPTGHPQRSQDPQAYNEVDPRTVPPSRGGWPAQAQQPARGYPQPQQPAQPQPQQPYDPGYGAQPGYGYQQPAPTHNSGYYPAQPAAPQYGADPQAGAGYPTGPDGYPMSQAPQGYGEPHANGYGALQQPHLGRGYETWSDQVPPTQPPGGYDPNESLSTYRRGPAAQQQGYAPQQQGYAPQQQGYPAHQPAPQAPQHAQHGGWAPQPDYAPQQGGPGHDYPSPQFGGMSHETPADRQLQSYDPAQPAIADEHGVHMDPVEDEPRTRSRLLITMVTLSLAIVIGSVIVYGAKIHFRPHAANGSMPVVKLDTKPAKVQPTDPGGTKFANADSKMLGRLDGASSDQDPQEPRKVVTIPVGRDGQLGAPVPTTVATATPPPAPGIPGITMVDGMRGGAPLPPPVAVPPPPAAPPSAVLPPAAPVLPQAAAPVAPAPPGAAAPVVPKAARKLLAKAPAAAPAPAPAPAAGTVVAAATPPAAPVAPPVNKAPNGYVAVVASKANRMDALKTFADLQERYGTLLANRVPDVQPSDLSARGLGIVQRLVVGPPGSRQEAVALCSQLKAAGYADCWVKPY